MLLFCKISSGSSNKIRIVTNNKRRSGIISPTIIDLDDEAEKIYLIQKQSNEASIRLALEKNEFLSNILQEKRLQHFIDSMYTKNVTEGDILIEEGEVGSHLYISKIGTYEITVQDNVVNIFNDMRVFGELAIIYSAKGNATVKCLENGTVWVLDCQIFNRRIIKTALEEQEEMVSFLKEVPILNSAPMEQLYQLANLLKVKYFTIGKEIVVEGEVGDTFYIIRAGTVTVLKDNDKVAQLRKGDFFGEFALLRDERHQSTVISDAPGVECLTLARKEFTHHFGELEEFIKMVVQPVYKEQVQEYSDLILDDFNRLNILGTGAFGKVELVRHEHYINQSFALKSMKKIEIIGRNHQDQIYNERDLQMACNSQFIVRLYRTFKDLKYIYLLLEVCLGGDLWNHLHRQKKHNFDETSAKFYAGCVVEALAYLHQHGVIYRDLKPENLIIHTSGYLKLTDFGFAKKIDSKEKTYTFVGTAEYIAPEIILNKGHTKGVDYWALGVLIYELLVGRTPFKTNNGDHMKTYKRILKGIDQAAFPYFLSVKAKSLIKKLCTQSSSDRLGCQRGGINNIKNHPWFATLNWYQLTNCMIEPPFIPELENNFDTKYFEDAECKGSQESIPPDFHSAWDEDF